MGKAMATIAAKAVTAMAEATNAAMRVVVKAVAVRGVVRAALAGQQCQQWWSAVEARREGHKEVGGSEGDGEGSGGDGGGERGGKVRASTSAILSMRHSHVCGCAQTSGECSPSHLPLFPSLSFGSADSLPLL